MDIETLHIFVEVVRRGSFAAVARDRKVDPSSISRTISSLEAELGTRLIQRTTRRLSVTEAGQIYFRELEQVIEHLDRAQTLATSLSSKPHGTLRIAAPVAFAQANIVPLLPEFSELYPDLFFDLVLTDTPLDLLNERLDAAFRIGPLEDSSYVATKLMTLEGYVCASPDYLTEHGRPETPEGLSEHNCMPLTLGGFSNRWRFRVKAGDEVEVPVQGNFTTSNAIALRDLAIAGMEVILQARWIVGDAVARGDLIDLFPEYEVTASYFDNAIWMMFPSRDYMPVKVRVFVDFLKSRFI